MAKQEKLAKKKGKKNIDRKETAKKKVAKKNMQKRKTLDIFQRLSDAIEEHGNNPEKCKLLCFDDFKIYEKLGNGQQGIVVKAINSSGKTFAIKFSKPTDKDPDIVKQAKNRFMREAKILINLGHHNIVGVYQFGSATLDDGQETWTISRKGDDEILFYVMEYIDGISVHEMFYEEELAKPANNMKRSPKVDPNKCTRENLSMFESLITQISEAIAFFHKKHIVHRDIKGKNIVYSTSDGVFKVVDFGFAKLTKNGTVEGSSPRGTIVRKEHLDIEIETREENKHLIDQFCFSLMIQNLLNDGFKHFYEDFNYNGMTGCLTKAHGPAKNRYENMDLFSQDIQPYLYAQPRYRGTCDAGSFLVPWELFGYLDSKVRIPFSGSIPVCKEVLKILDTKSFQRLRGVRQLGPTHFVYPGATHTRFEHSLGAYHLALQYLQVLVNNSEFVDVVTPVGEAIKLVVLAALLHDTGHYPYSHMTEEMHGLPSDWFRKHEQEARTIIEQDPISLLIKDDWGIEPSKVCDLIDADSANPREQLLKSIVDSAIDVDKLDYLQRDSAHCGVPYGKGFDVERFIGSLTLNKTRNAICLSEKARSCFFVFFTGKIVMYQEVYWHKALRASVAMYKRYVYKLLETKRGRLVLRKLRECGDDEYIRGLIEYGKSIRRLKPFVGLLQPLSNNGRELYKAAYVHYHGHTEYVKRCTLTAKFFAELTKFNYPELIRTTDTLVKKLKKYIRNLKPQDLILETTPITSSEAPDDTEIRKLEFWDPYLNDYQPLDDEVENLLRYLNKNRRSFIFCKSQHRNRIQELQKDGTLGKILAQIIRERK